MSVVRSSWQSQSSLSSQSATPDFLSISKGLIPVFKFDKCVIRQLHDNHVVSELLLLGGWIHGWMDGWMGGDEECSKGRRKGHKSWCCVYLLESVFALLSQDPSLTVIVCLEIILIRVKEAESREAHHSHSILHLYIFYSMADVGIKLHYQNNNEYPCKIFKLNSIF